MAQKRGSPILVIFILLIVISAIVVAWIYKDKGLDFIKDKYNAWAGNNETINDTTILANNILILKSKNTETMNYIVKDQFGNAIQKGFLFKTPEIIYDIQLNQTYTIDAYSDSRYYFKSSECFAQTNETICSIGLDLKAQNPRLSINDAKINIEFDDGSIKEPKLCIGWQYPLTDVYIPDLLDYEIEVIDEYKQLADKCYALNFISSNTYFDYYTKGDRTGSKVNIYLHDFENDLDLGIPDLDATITYS